jgi:hypothetical protein
LHGPQVPYFIEDGGYFSNNGRLIGLTRDDASCHVPPSTELVTITTKEEFATYVIALTLSTPLEGVLSTEQKTALANSWWDARC